MSSLKQIAAGRRLEITPDFFLELDFVVVRLEAGGEWENTEAVGLFAHLFIVTDISRVLSLSTKLFCVLLCFVSFYKSFSEMAPRASWVMCPCSASVQNPPVPWQNLLPAQPFIPLAEH